MALVRGNSAKLEGKRMGGRVQQAVSPWVEKMEEGAWNMERGIHQVRMMLVPF